MAMVKKTVRYDDGWKSQMLYYGKRFGKHALSFVIAALISFALNDNRFIAVVPFLELAQKYAKEKGYWF